MYIYKNFNFMKNIYFTFILLVSIVVNAQNVQSVSKNLSLDFKLSKSGQPSYSVTYKGKKVVLESTLGLKLKDKRNF